ncbi:uncharacterized protein MONBRDRAFT_24562 [Monosiga brevicollis MX1]|uniref:Zinc finger PHD-type domain-containing protein n=1 Tax=Monosiga brevicollis TaxID=81824 RepID=A9UWT6_MONBE|nr:uncharacterized protein MONBRDRAFT_24562 [Monosiga brevicollis MX1]EDQ90272.1 predicted protein [Monosiga brevicollis MX1]|eukprot:XP_001745039.1 hypothetical protein [Monosiga brevicollis MX1]
MHAIIDSPDSDSSPPSPAQEDLPFGNPAARIEALVTTIAAPAIQPVDVSIPDATAQPERFEPVSRRTRPHPPALETPRRPSNTTKHPCKVPKLVAVPIDDSLESGDDSSVNCAACGEPKAGPTVTCARCASVYHYRCAGDVVSKRVRQHRWACDSCRLVKLESTAAFAVEHHLPASMPLDCRIRSQRGTTTMANRKRSRSSGTGTRDNGAARQESRRHTQITQEGRWAVVTLVLGLGLGWILHVDTLQDSLTAPNETFTLLDQRCGIQIADGFVTEAEIDHILRLVSQAGGWMPSSTGGPDFMVPRTLYGRWEQLVRQDSVMNALEARIARATGIKPHPHEDLLSIALMRPKIGMPRQGHVVPWGLHHEGLASNFGGELQGFQRHVDFDVHYDHEFNDLLSEACQGAYGVSIEPRRGRAVLFDTQRRDAPAGQYQPLTWHGGCNVIEGEKILLQKFKEQPLEKRTYTRFEQSMPYHPHV